MNTRFRQHPIFLIPLSWKLQIIAWTFRDKRDNETDIKERMVQWEGLSEKAIQWTTKTFVRRWRFIERNTWNTYHDDWTACRRVSWTAFSELVQGFISLLPCVLDSRVRECNFPCFDLLRLKGCYVEREAGNENTRGKLKTPNKSSWAQKFCGDFESHSWHQQKNDAVTVNRRTQIRRKEQSREQNRQNRVEQQRRDPRRRGSREWRLKGLLISTEHATKSKGVLRHCFSRLELASSVETSKETQPNFDQQSYPWFEPNTFSFLHGIPPNRFSSWPVKLRRFPFLDEIFLLLIYHDKEMLTMNTTLARFFIVQSLSLKSLEVLERWLRGSWVERSMEYESPIVSFEPHLLWLTCLHTTHLPKKSYRMQKVNTALRLH